MSAVDGLSGAAVAEAELVTDGRPQRRPRRAGGAGSSRRRARWAAGGSRSPRSSCTWSSSCTRSSPRSSTRSTTGTASTSRRRSGWTTTCGSSPSRSCSPRSSTPSSSSSSSPSSPCSSRSSWPRSSGRSVPRSPAAWRARCSSCRRSSPARGGGHRVDVDVRARRRRQPGAARGGRSRRPGPALARRLHLGPAGGRHHRHLARDGPVHAAAHVGHRQDRRQPLRGGPARRGEPGAAVPQRDPPGAAAGDRGCA